MTERRLDLTKHDPAAAAAPRPSRARHILGIALEGLVSLSLALLCFLIFLWVLDTVFPSGVGLRRELSLDHGQRHDKWGLDRVPEGVRPAAAVLRVFSNEVKVRTPDQIAWSPAKHGGPVSEGDAIQTMRDGEAMLKFNDGSALQLGRNSLLVVRSREERRNGAAAFMVPKGELWGTLPPAESGEEVSVNTPNAVVKVGTAKGSATSADFKVLVGPDRSSIVAVYHGSASVTSGDQTTEVTENHFVAVDSSGAQSAVAKLPDAPAPTGPADGARFTYSDPPPRFAFQWTPMKGADQYRLVVARDAAFQNVVLDRTLDAPRLDFGRLSMGDYVWHVSTIRDHVEGRPSATLALHVKQDDAAPRLEVEFPEGPIVADQVTIRGVTDNDTRVIVAGHPATVNRGSFSCSVPLKRGLNVVVVEAIDPSGNAAYSSKVLEARY